MRKRSESISNEKELCDVDGEVGAACRCRRYNDDGGLVTSGGWRMQA